MCISYLIACMTTGTLDWPNSALCPSELHKDNAHNFSLSAIICGANKTTYKQT